MKGQVNRIKLTSQSEDIWPLSWKAARDDTCAKQLLRRSEISRLTGFQPKPWGGVRDLAAAWQQVTPDLFVASPVFLQNPQGVVGPLTLAVELHTPCQAVVLHLTGRWREWGGKAGKRERRRWNNEETKMQAIFGVTAWIQTFYSYEGEKMRGW